MTAPPGGPVISAQAAEAIATLLYQADPASGLVGEPAAKKILRTLGLRTPEGGLCTTEDQAVQVADRIGYPVVLKVISPGITHKSEVGGVKVGLGWRGAVRAAFAEIQERVRSRLPGSEITGILVERMVSGHELLVGASRTEFGPLILFGLGGITVELLQDVSYRLAPLERSQATEMVRGIRVFPLLQGFRGQPPVDLDALADLLVRVSDLVVEYPQIRELDINPLMAQHDELVSADARIVVDRSPPVGSVDGGEYGPQDEAWQALWWPRSVAVVGATTGRYNRAKAWMSRVERAGYRGRLYAVSRRDQVEHWPTFARVSDIAERPDLVMVEVGQDSVAEVVQECVRCRVPWISVHTAGFAERGDQEGAQRLLELQTLLQGSASFLIGPNAMGPYSPGAGILPGEVMARSGPLALLSQSGVTFLALGKIAEEKEIGVSKGVSYGSEGGVTADAFLNYLAEDSETQVIAMYLEGVRRPRAFAAALERAARAKPVVVLKGGITQAGAQAAASHSGALVGSAQGWTALLTRTRAVQAETFEDLVDLVVAFTHLHERFARRVAIVTPSGAAAVTYADACSRQGFEAPALSPETRGRLSALLPPGTSARNPADVAQAYFRKDIMQPVLSAVAEDPSVSLVVFHLAMDVYAQTVEHAPWAGQAFLQTLVEAKDNGKPLVVVLPYTIADAKRAEVERYLLSQGLAVFPTMDRALKALGMVLWYRVGVG